nr:hypothetical protein GCM10020063_077700 [Dactylosporangium thailandense]
MKSKRSTRLGLALAAAIGAIGVSMLIPAVAMPAVPNPLPDGIQLGGLHLNPTSGTGAEMPSFTADHACPAAATLANVNTIDLAGTEQTLSNNASLPAISSAGFGSTFFTDMATVQSLAGDGGEESFLFVVDCRTGAGHGTYTDAVQVDFKADGSWLVHGTTPGTPTPTPTVTKTPTPTATVTTTPTPTATETTPTPEASISPTPAAGTGNLPVTGAGVAAIAAAAVAMIGVGIGLRYAARRRGSGY